MLRNREYDAEITVEWFSNEFYVHEFGRCVSSKLLTVNSRYIFISIKNICLFHGKHDLCVANATLSFELHDNLPTAQELVLSYYNAMPKNSKSVYP